jgi:hypothetical protein
MRTSLTAPAEMFVAPAFQLMVSDAVPSDGIPKVCCEVAKSAPSR